MDEYTEYTLYSAGPDIDYHHVMKIPSQKFDINTLKPPVTLCRHKPEAKPDEPKSVNPFKKKTKAFFLGRDDDDVSIENGGDGSFVKHDPDKHPWVLADDENQTYFGNVEGSQQSNYVLLVSAVDGFNVIPSSKWYKFMPKVNYRTLTTEEAENRMKKALKAESRAERWLMHGAVGDLI